jgi:dTMP kinase
MARGRFITVEGGEGSGKSTQLRRLATALAGRSIACVLTREPGGCPGAEQIRRLLVEGATGRWQPMTEALLHYAARVEHVTRTIEPALGCGDWVLSDRFADSTTAYQGYGHGLGADAIDRLHRLALGSLRPDLTLIFDLPVEQGLARARARGGDEDRYERMDRAFHERLRAGFLEIARAEPQRCAVIDAGGDIDSVAAMAWAAVSRRLALA